MNYENSGATSAAGHTGNSSVTTDNVSGTHTFVLSGAAVLDSRLTYTRDNEPGEANSADPEAVIRQGGFTAIRSAAITSAPGTRMPAPIQWADSLSYVHGRHTFKAGLDMNFQHIDNFFPGNFSGSYTFNSYADFASNRPFSFTQAFAGAEHRRAALHSECQRVRLLRAGFLACLRGANAELRHSLRSVRPCQPEGQESRSGPRRRQPGHQPDPARQEQLRRTLRLRLPAVQEWQHGVRGGVGNYYGRTPSILTGTAFTQNGIQVQTYTLTANLPTYPNILSAPPALNRTPDIYVFAKDYVQPLTWQWSLNLERQLGPRLRRDRSAIWACAASI